MSGCSRLTRRRFRRDPTHALFADQSHSFPDNLVALLGPIRAWHCSVVERSGHSNVPPGATLEVRAGPGPKGSQVSEILSVDSSTAQQEPPRRPRPERPMYPQADRAAVEESGTVKWYNAMKGFGFIASDRGGKDIFVHASALDRAGITGLTEGQRVAVDVIDSRKGPEAAGLRLI